MAIQAGPSITEPRRVLIADRRAFAKQLAAAVSAEYSSVNAAALDLEIPQPVLSRLINRKHTWISAGTWRRLEPLIGKDDAAIAAVLPPFAQKAERTWEQWMASEADRIVGGSSERARRTKQQELRALRRRMEGEIALAYIVSAIEQLQNRDRAELARRRILEPLLQAGESGWIERNGWELTASEFCRFVKAGWKREEVLLRREGETSRAQMSMALSLAASAVRMGRTVQVSVSPGVETPGFRQHVPVTVKIYSKQTPRRPGSSLVTRK